MATPLPIDGPVTIDKLAPIEDPAPIDGHLPDQVLHGAADRSFHGYVHVPFCRVKCGYCDFNTYTATELEGAKQSDFAKKLIQEVDFARSVIDRSGLPKRTMDTVFFGGGTPSQLPASDLVQMLGVIERQFGFSPGAEITSEANPDDVSAEFFLELKAGGFTRVSIGMQSAVPSVLETLERSHNPENVSRAVELAKAANLGVSVDLIYGAPGETLEQWETSIRAAIEMQPDHISAYSLIVEPGTKLARQISRGELSEPDEDLQADKYELTDRLLAEAGFGWYEISNWSRGESKVSAHNFAYWNSRDWWGFGPGAHSHIGGVRWWNVKHPSAYAGRLQRLESPAAGREVLDERTRLEERILLEIRIRSGLSIELAKQVSVDATKFVAGFIADGLVDPAHALRGNLVLTLKGRLLADSLVRQLLG
jgi:oxygen-independent coproporphyrinogen-3 oxidase